jgi:aminopeptidase N
MRLSSPSRRGRLRWFAVAGAVLLVVAFGSAPAAARQSSPKPGAAGIGDPLFPLLGNGGYDVRRYELDFVYESAKGPVTGTATIVARAQQALSRFDLDYAGTSVTRVAVNGRAAAYSRQGEELVITPQRPLRDGRVFVVDVDFAGGPVEADPNVLITPWFLTADGSATAPQPDGAHDIFPSNDHPSDKASYLFRIDVPEGITAVANGIPGWRRTADGRTVYTYVQQEPMASELVQLAVGALDVIDRGRLEGVRLRDLAPTSLADDLEPAFATTPGHLEWLQDFLGRFPFRIYGEFAADTSLGFALETQTLSLYPAFLFLPPVPPQAYEPIMVHEDAHQWFGDSVSPARWSDVWLNEGHATWYEQLYADFRGWEDFEAFMRATYARGDQLRAQYGPTAAPKSAENIFDLFNPNVYEGGALVLYALYQRVGEDTFYDIERAWLDRYRDQSASTTQFIRLASRVAHRDLTAFLTAWLYGATTPPMPGHPDWTVDPVGSPAPSGAPAAQERATTLSVRKR